MKRQRNFSEPCKKRNVELNTYKKHTNLVYYETSNFHSFPLFYSIKFRLCHTQMKQHKEGSICFCISLISLQQLLFSSACCPSMILGSFSRLNCTNAVNRASSCLKETSFTLILFLSYFLSVFDSSFFLMISFSSVPPSSFSCMSVFIYIYIYTSIYAAMSRKMIYWLAVSS